MTPKRRRLSPQHIARVVWLSFRVPLCLRLVKTQTEAGARTSEETGRLAYGRFRFLRHKFSISEVSAGREKALFPYYQSQISGGG